MIGPLGTTSASLPASVTGYARRYRASSITGLVNNDPVTTWTEPGGFDATSSGTARPLYKTNAVNGKPALLFDGSNDAMNFTGPTLAGDFLIQVVQQTTGDSFLLGNQASNYQFRFNFGTNTLAFYDGASNPAGIIPAVVSRSSFTLIEIMRRSGAICFFENGLPIPSQPLASASVNFNCFGLPWAGLLINGLIAETAIYSGMPAIPIRQSSLRYYANEYGLPTA